jgi:hypothetical protein
MDLICTAFGKAAATYALKLKQTEVQRGHFKNTENLATALRKRIRLPFLDRLMETSWITLE